MKPLIIHTESSLGWGGQEIRVFKELVGMQDRGYATALLAPCRSTLYQRAAAAGVAVHHVPFASKLDLVSWIRLIRLMRLLCPVVLNVHSSEDSWLAGAVGRLWGNCLVIRTRHVSTPVGSLFSYSRLTDHLLTTSTAIRDSFIQQGMAPEKVTAMPTGIEMERFCFSGEGRKRVRQALTLGEEHFLIGNLCVLRSWKGLDFFLETAALLPEPFRFILVGDGPQRQRLEEKAHNLGLGGRIIFAGHQEEAVDYFSAMDLLFYTSYASEGVPQSLLQGVASGLPVVAVRLPSIVETLQGVQKVRWVEYGDGPVAAAILAAAAGGETDWQSRQPPPLEWQQRHSLAGMLDSLDALYTRLMPVLKQMRQ